jgi:hypothetical protein
MPADLTIRAIGSRAHALHSLTSFSAQSVLAALALSLLFSPLHRIGFEAFVMPAFSARARAAAQSACTRRSCSRGSSTSCCSMRTPARSALCAQWSSWRARSTLRCVPSGSCESRRLTRDVADEAE